jgi:hypothetical protein
MMRGIKLVPYKLILGLLALICMFMLSAPQYSVADTSGMQTGTPGAYGVKPLHFVSITLVDGGGNVVNSTTVPLNPRFKLLFDKNIVDDGVWGINSRCFQLYDQNNQETPVRVTRINDTVDFSQRQAVFVQPTRPLNPGAAYRLKVSPKLLARNDISVLSGTTGGQGVTISFATVAAQSAAQPAQAAMPATQNAAPTMPQAVTPSPKPTPSGKQQLPGQPGALFAVAGPQAGSQETTGNPALDWLTALTVALIAGWGAVEIVLLRKKKKAD